MELVRSTLAALPQEILLQVFRKLRIKSVIRCKLVCKEWASLISDPFFTTNYNCNSIPNEPISLMTTPRSYPSSLMYIYELNSLQVAHPTHPLSPDFTANCLGDLVGCCNGLVALFYYKIGHRGGQCCIFNPVTREKKLVSVDDHPELEVSWVISGLCHDSIRDEYKTVLRRNNRFWVVSFKDDENCKTKTQPELLHHLVMYWRKCITLQGVPHWAAFSSSRTPLKQSVLYFDPVKEEFATIGVPVEWGSLMPSGPRWGYGLGALDGKLTALVEDEVWALNKHGDANSWTLQFVLADFPIPVGFDMVSARTISIVRRMDYEEVLIEVNSEWWMLYNPKNRSWRQLGKREKGKGDYRVPTYVPSLVSPNR